MKNTKRRIALLLSAGAVLLCLCLSACGSLKVYDTPHTSEKTEIKDISDLIFEKGASPETVAKKFNDFCIYKSESGSGKTSYRAVVPGVFGKDEYETSFSFSADKELTEWIYSYYGKDSFGVINGSESEEMLQNYNYIYDLVKTKYGDPVKENKNGGDCNAEWEIDSNRKLIMNLKVELPTVESEEGTDFKRNTDYATNTNGYGIYVQYTINY